MFRHSKRDESGFKPLTNLLHTLRKPTVSILGDVPTTLSPPGAGLPGVRASWDRQPWVLRILRAFLGVTFAYAGIQKFADPNFLHPGTPDFIGAQLSAFAAGSPLRPLLLVLGHASALTGVAIAVLELAIGLATLAGVAPVSAAVAGMMVNLLLFLSATWRVHPYFLGSDSIYAVAWAAYAAGLVEQARRAARTGRQGRRGARRRAQADPGRRAFIRGASVAAGAVVMGAAASAFAATPASAPAAGVARRSRRHGSENAGRSGTSGSGPGLPVSGTPVARLDRIPVGGAVGFDDPAQGPSILVRLGQNEVVAYSRACTHAGCPVGYDSGARLIVCPCHGAEFDPAQGASVVAGPAQEPLAPVKVVIDPATGEVVAQS
jgi:thiosulfate dehydrogenase (quinone) large subunit